MLYDSTKSLLQSILRSLETVDDTGWDDQVESGNSCLYEMHQMSGSLYAPYKSDGKGTGSLAQSLGKVDQRHPARQDDGDCNPA